jgi:hypothetical protein
MSKIFFLSNETKFHLDLEISIILEWLKQNLKLGRIEFESRKHSEASFNTYAFIFKQKVKITLNEMGSFNERKEK